VRGIIVAKDRHAVLNALLAELAFIEAGAYRNPTHAAWRPQFVFQDSPTCLNRNPLERRKPCSECVLGRFLPVDSRGERVPCRYIPLNPAGETIDSLYRAGTQEEVETALVEWLKTTIQWIEREEAEELRSQENPVIHVQAKFATDQMPAPRPSMLSICANPECRAPFSYGGGRFFRFRQIPSDGNQIPNLHAVQHFWLCSTCCQQFTLGFRDGVGVVIKNRPDLALEADMSRPISVPPR